MNRYVCRTAALDSPADEAVSVGIIRRNGLRVDGSVICSAVTRGRGPAGRNIACCLIADVVDRDSVIRSQNHILVGHAECPLAAVEGDSAGYDRPFGLVVSCHVRHC